MVKEHNEASSKVPKGPLDDSTSAQDNGENKSNESVADSGNVTGTDTSDAIASDKSASDTNALGPDDSAANMPETNMLETNTPETNPSQTKAPLGNNADAQIQAHRQAHQQKLKKIILIIGALTLLGAAIFGFSSFFGRSDQNAQQTNNEPIVTLSEQQIAQYRDQFKQALTQFEINIQPSIDAMKLADWRSSDTGGLTLLKEQVLTNFAKGAYAESKIKLEKLYDDANSLITAWQSELAQHLAQAQDMFTQGSIPQAQLALNKAKAVQINNREVASLQSRIYAFSEIETLLDDLKVAKIERNLPKQIEVLSDIIVLDPQRTTLNQDLQQAKSDYDAKQLADALDKAQQAFEAGQLSMAQDFVKQAQSIKASSKGVKALQTKIDARLSQQSLAQIKQEIAVLAKNDNWQAVASKVQSVKQSYGSDSSLDDYQNKAQSVLSAKRSIAIFVRQPQRLADQNIRDAAQNAIQQAIGASIHSPSLQADIMQVANTIDTYASPVDVTIESDGDSHILVIGVGHVGKHEKKVIQLTPGEYILEARREGYRNKRLEFIVEANTPITVKLVAEKQL